MKSIQSDLRGVSVENLNKSYGVGEGRNHVLHDVSTQFHAGELSLLVGPSGCGKTSLISIIAGILSADSGTIKIFDTDLHHLNTAQKTEFRKQTIGFIFQQFNLVPTLNVQENVAIPLLIQGMARRKAMSQAAAMLQEVHLLPQIELLPNLLSVGQQQRIAVARALVTQPKLLICDEPTASLDAENGRNVMQLISRLAVQEDRVVIIVTHDQRVLDFGDRVIEMEDGRIRHSLPRSDYKELL